MARAAHPAKMQAVRSPKSRPLTWIEDRPPRRGKAPAPVGQVLAEAQKVTSQKAGSALAPDEWRRIVGAKIAARTRVGKLSRGTLTLYAASSAWCSELSFLTTEIIARLQKGGWQVHALRVQVASIDAQPAPEPTPPVLRAKLSPELRARLALIDDPALRSAVAEAAALSLANAKQQKPSKP